MSKLVTENLNFENLVMWGKLDSKIEKGELVITCENDWSMMTSDKQFKLPLKIEMKLKTTGVFCVYFRRAKLLMNWPNNESELWLSDPLSGRFNTYQNRGSLPKNKYLDVTWIIEKDSMTVLVGNELRVMDNAFGYVNHKKPIEDWVRISTDRGSTIRYKDVKVSYLK